MLAVGVVALALVSVLGLLPVATNASRQVSDETTIATLAADMFHWRRVCAFDKRSSFPDDDNTKLTTPRPKEVVFYCDVNGHQDADSRYTGPYFKVTYKVENHPSYTDVDRVGNIARVVVKFEWPVIPAAGSPTLAPYFQSRVFVSQYVRAQ
jgi:hypothetical protein